MSALTPHKMKMDALELRRQIAHLLYGPFLIALHYFGLLPLNLMLLLIAGGGAASWLIKRQRMSFLAKMLSWFEREHHMQAFPGKGILFFTLGAYLSLLFFRDNLAYAGIMVLSVGDSVSHIAGRLLGRTKALMNPHKFIEGNLIAIAASVPAAYFFFPHFVAAF